MPLSIVHLLSAAKPCMAILGEGEREGSGEEEREVSDIDSCLANINFITIRHFLTV